MKLLLYYCYGSCNDGDHSYDVEEFDFMPALRLRLDELIKLAYGAQYITYKVICGIVLEDHP